MGPPRILPDSSGRRLALGLTYMAVRQGPCTAGYVRRRTHLIKDEVLEAGHPFAASRGQKQDLQALRHRH